MTNAAVKENQVKLVKICFTSLVGLFVLAIGLSRLEGGEDSSDFGSRQLDIVAAEVVDAGER